MIKIYAGLIVTAFTSLTMHFFENAARANCNDIVSAHATYLSVRLF